MMPGQHHEVEDVKFITLLILSRHSSQAKQNLGRQVMEMNQNTPRVHS